MNDNCLRKVSVATIFFMPHCEIFMYENVLKANLKHLQMIYIIGNSFDLLRRKSEFIEEKVSVSSELKICDQLSSNVVWNDTSVHSFSSEKSSQ